MVITPLPFRTGLEQYKKQAADLIKGYRSGDPEAMYRIRQLHARLRGRAHTNDRNVVTDSEIRRARVTFADAQCVVARWYGFENWPTLEEFIKAVAKEGSSVWQFESAVEGGHPAHFSTDMKGSVGPGVPKVLNCPVPGAMAQRGSDHDPGCPRANPNWKSSTYRQAV